MDRSSTCLRRRWASLGALRSTEGLTAQAPAPTDTFIVTSARHYKPFERWVLSKGLDVDRVINTGDTLSPVCVTLDYDACQAIIHGCTVALAE